MHRDPSGYFMTTRDETGTHCAMCRCPSSSAVSACRTASPSCPTALAGPAGLLPRHLGRLVDYNERKQGQVSAQHPFFWTRFRRNANHECLDATPPA